MAATVGARRAPGLEDEAGEYERAHPQLTNQKSSSRLRSKFMRSSSSAPSPSKQQQLLQQQPSTTSQAAVYAQQQLQQAASSPTSEQHHLEVSSAGGHGVARAPSPVVSAGEDDGYVSATSWDHSQSMVHHSARARGVHDADTNTSTHDSDAHNGAASDWDGTTESMPGHSMISHNSAKPVMPSRPPPRAQKQQLGQPVEFATRLQNQASSDVDAETEEDSKSLAQIQNEQAASGAVPPVPAIPNAHAGAPRSRTTKRSPVLSYAEGEAEEERIYQATDQNTDLKRMASFGPKLKKNAPAPWEVEGGDEEFLMLPHNHAHGSGGSSSPSSVGKQQGHQWFARKSTDVREHGSSPEKAAARPSIDRMRSAGDSVLTSDDATDSASGSGSFFANTRARSKSVSSSAAGMLKGLGLTASSAQPMKKKLPKLGKLPKSGDEKKSRMPHSAGISSADYQNVPPDWSPTAAASEPAMTPAGSIPPMPLTPSHLSQRASSTSSAAGLPLRQSSRQESTTVPPVPITQETYRMRQSSSNDSNNLSSISPTDASQSTAATSPATPSFGDVISSSSKNVMTASPTLRSTAQMEALASAGSEILNDDASHNVMQNKYEGTTPYKLISLEQARMNQIREKELARQRMESSTATATSSSSAAGDTPRAGVAADAFFPTAASRTSLSSDHHPTRGADTKSLRSKKSGFLRIFNKDKGMDAPALPSSQQFIFGEDAPPARDPSVPLPRNGGGSASQLAAPALSLRPMSSMFSNFEPELLDGSVTGEKTSINGTSPQRSPALSSGSRGPQDYSVQGNSNSSSLSSRRRGPAPAEIIATPYNNFSNSLGPKSANSLFAANALPRRTSSDTSESHQGAFFSPATSPAVPGPDFKQRPSSVHSYDSSASGRPTIDVVASVPSSAWKDRVMEIEQKMAELANELSAMRHQQAQAGFVPTSPLADQAEAYASSPSFGSHSPNPDTLISTTAIPPCSMCGCECAEKRREKALNEAAVLRGVSILARGRAIKPLGEGNTTKFGGYRDR